MNLAISLQPLNAHEDLSNGDSFSACPSRDHNLLVFLGHDVRNANNNFECRKNGRELRKIERKKIDKNRTKKNKHERSAFKMLNSKTDDFVFKRGIIKHTNTTGNMDEAISSNENDHLIVIG